MIDISEFNKLKIGDVLGRSDTDKVWDYKYLGRTWFGETYAFSHSLSLYLSPFKTKSIAINPVDMKTQELSSLLGVELLTLTTQADCDLLFGEPILIDEFSDDRKTYIYSAGDRYRYELGFTILNDGGLAYFTMESIDVAENKKLHR